MVRFTDEGDTDNPCEDMARDRYAAPDDQVNKSERSRVCNRWADYRQGWRIEGSVDGCSGCDHGGNDSSSLVAHLPDKMEAPGKHDCIVAVS